MNWLFDLGVPDAQLIVGYMNSAWCSIDRIATVFHEKIELREWLRLGHDFEDIMNLDYYQAHYDQVYPVVHRQAIKLELALINLFAYRAGIHGVSDLSLMIVHPLIEDHHTDVTKFVRRLKFNQEILRQASTCEELGVAALVFEFGGYAYTDRIKILREGCNFLKSR